MLPLRRSPFLFCLVLAALSFSTASAQEQAKPADFKTVVRPGSVKLDEEYDLDGLSIPKDEIHRLLGRDRIPSLTQPATEEASKSAEWLRPASRLIEVKVGDDLLAVPLQILDAHEIVNVTLGGEPIAVTYCPLCDSATVFSRLVESPGKEPVKLEFGVSGALYNSNVLMYDRTHKGLWSQLGMKAVSGPLVGTRLKMLSFKVTSYETFAAEHPKGSIVSRETTYSRDYTRSRYTSYFFNDQLIVPVKGIGQALKRKTLGVGVVVGEQAYFVAGKAIDESGYTLATPEGDVKLSKSKAGMVVQAKPPSVLAAQTFYYSWSAFYPETKVITGE